MTKTAMNMMDLLRQTNSEEGRTRIELIQLPHDVYQQERFALVAAGPNAPDVMKMLTDALDAYFTRAIEAQDAIDVDGPDPGP